jgi:hypothetical protein
VRSKIVKLNKNVEEIETSTSVIDNEEKHSRLLETFVESTNVTIDETSG